MKKYFPIAENKSLILKPLSSASTTIFIELQHINTHTVISFNNLLINFQHHTILIYTRIKNVFFPENNRNNKFTIAEHFSPALK